MGTEEPKSKIQILFVDDNRSFLQMAQGMMGELSEGRWQTHVSPSASEALERLKAQPFELVVLDFAMPGVGGVELLQMLNQAHPNLPVVFLTSASDPKTRLTALEAGAVMFLEKPDSPTGMESVFATLNELLKWQVKLGERGAGRKANLVDIVKFECAAGHSKLIEIVVEGDPGRVYLKDGAIIHAEAQGRRGQSAFTFLTSSPDAEFVLKQFEEPPERSVYRQWEFLVLEAFQLREQLTQAKAEKRPETPAAAKPAPPAEVPSSEPTSPEPSGSDIEGVRDMMAAASRRRAAPTPPPDKPAHPDAPPTPAEPSPKVLEPVLAKLRAAPPSVPVAMVLNAQETVIEEVLVSSVQEEVLFEWHSPNSRTRLGSVRAIRSKCTALNARLNLGELDRLELMANEGRMVVQFQGDTSLLVRTNTRSRPMVSSVPPFNQPLADWLARQSQIGGLLACGLVRPNLAPVSCSYSGELPSDGLNPLWRAALDLLEQFRQPRFTAWQLRWLFHQTQLYCVKRMDGVAIAALFCLDAQVLDAPAAQQMFAEFSALLVG